MHRWLLSLLTPVFTVQFHHCEPQQEVESTLSILQTLLQPEPHFSTSASEQMISEVPKTGEGIIQQGLIIPVHWICGHQHAGLETGTLNMSCALVIWI